MGLTSPGFRSYADYMGEEEFRKGVVELLSVASESRTAYMCAEALYWQCHRRLLSDYLVAQGVEVLHILGSKNLRSHKITEGALVTQEGNVIYPAMTGERDSCVKLYSVCQKQCGRLMQRTEGLAPRWAAVIPAQAESRLDPGSESGVTVKFSKSEKNLAIGI